MNSMPRRWDVWAVVSSRKSSSSNGQMCFSWSGGTRYVTELAVLFGVTDARGVPKTRAPGTKAIGGSVRDALGSYLEARRDAHDARGQVPGGAQRSRMALSDAGCAGDSDWAVSEMRRTTTGAFEQFGRHPIEFSCSTSHILKRIGRAVCHRT